jgi:hypothetical protein
MKKTLFLICFVFFGQTMFGQNYFPFPSDAASWNCLDWHQWSQYDIFLTNYQYTQEGDTNIDGKIYRKIYHQDIDYSGDVTLLGGIREDQSKNIYFYPFNTDVFPPTGGLSFPSDSSENLLYTFNNLTIGMILPINTENTTLQVVGIDSVLIGNQYHRRYQIQNPLLLSDDFWIEGIGSTLELFSPFTFEFEWTHFTLCFTDSITYFINPPNGEDSCHYSLPTGIDEFESQNLFIYPNPAEDIIRINGFKGTGQQTVEIYNAQAQLILSKKIDSSDLELDIRNLKPGLYFVKLAYKHQNLGTTFIRK